MIIEDAFSSYFSVGGTGGDRSLKKRNPIKIFVNFTILRHLQKERTFLYGEGQKRNSHIVENVLLENVSLSCITSLYLIIILHQLTSLKIFKN
jgi:hypothetical protein